MAPDRLAMHRAVPRAAAQSVESVKRPAKRACSHAHLQPLGMAQQCWEARRSANAVLVVQETGRHPISGEELQKDDLIYLKSNKVS